MHQRHASWKGKEQMNELMNECAIHAAFCCGALDITFHLIISIKLSLLPEKHTSLWDWNCRIATGWVEVKTNEKKRTAQCCLVWMSHLSPQVGFSTPWGSLYQLQPNLSQHMYFLYIWFALRSFTVARKFPHRPGEAAVSHRHRPSAGLSRLRPGPHRPQVRPMHLQNHRQQRTLCRCGVWWLWRPFRWVCVLEFPRNFKLKIKKKRKKEITSV